MANPMAEIENRESAHERVEALEGELLRLSRELAAANREAASLRERLRCERADREQLLQVVSHELRTPITFISGYNRLLLSGEVGPLNDDQRRFLIESTKGCQRLSAFVGNLLEASREVHGGEVLEISTESVAEVLREVAQLFAHALEEQGVDLRIDVEGTGDGIGPLEVRCDRLRVEQVLTNLISNALKAVSGDARIELAARPATPGHDAREMVEISVSDNGGGIGETDLERIFDPYVQAGGSHQAGGLGLGLAICRRLVEAHGGRICAMGRPGGGARFAFTLPRRDPAED